MKERMIFCMLHGMIESVLFILFLVFLSCFFIYDMCFLELLFQYFLIDMAHWSFDHHLLHICAGLLGDT